MKTALLLFSLAAALAFGQNTKDNTTYKGHCVHWENGSLVINSRACNAKTPSADEDYGAQMGALFALQALRMELEVQAAKGKDVDIAGIIKILSAIEKEIVK